MAKWTSRRGWLATLLLLTLPLASGAADRRPDYEPAAYAIEGATIVTGAGQTIENGTVVVRDGVIEAVGKSDEVTVPYDAETIDGKGLFVYPGFIDLYTTLGRSPNTTRSETGEGRNIPYNDFALPETPPDNRNGLTPEFRMAEELTLPDKTVEDHRRLGFTDLLAAPGGAIATGQSALVSLGGLPRRESIVKSPVALHINVRPPFEPASPGESPSDAFRRSRRSDGGYPMSTMGAVAHLRQAMLDAEHHRQALLYYKQHGGPRPAYDPALEALHGRPGLRPSRSGGKPTPAMRSTACSTWPRSSAPMP